MLRKPMLSSRRRCHHSMRKLTTSPLPKQHRWFLLPRRRVMFPISRTVPRSGAEPWPLEVNSMMIVSVSKEAFRPRKVWTVPGQTVSISEESFHWANSSLRRATSFSLPSSATQESAVSRCSQEAATSMIPSNLAKHSRRWIGLVRYYMEPKGYSVSRETRYKNMEQSKATVVEWRPSMLGH